eukprot:CAMPEP_0173279172 /NCGR_PEP_ID=MMETSP1143-20121109/5005_1 /TAXON_ID=483371 /ORGANISM="non described non described, Strain CCMP2298" /LENGTH=36 /DNA_ID= /DNA_START= /DNA_END= /DNA_ORIENTATION=
MGGNEEVFEVGAEPSQQAAFGVAWCGGKGTAAAPDG